MKNVLRSLGASIAHPITAAFYVLALLLIAAYIFLYQYTPLDPRLNDVFLNSIITLGACAAAVLSTLILRYYDRNDHPRRVWKNLMIASWLWFFGELAWQLYAFFFDVVPVPSIADAFWLMGFVFYTLAVYRQYTLIMPARSEIFQTFAVGAWLAALLLPALYLSVVNSFTIGFLIEFFYPVADLAVGLAGFALVYIFRGGALVRPWIGLMVFTLSDLMYAWAGKTEAYAVSAENGNLLSLFIDTSYLAAYLILGIGFLGQWILLRYGIGPSRKEAPLRA